MRLAEGEFFRILFARAEVGFFRHLCLPLVITRESWLTVYCRPGSSTLDDDEFARHATMPHAIPPFPTSLPRIRHANWKSGGAASVCRRNAFTRDRHATNTPFASIAARKDARILRTSPLSSPSTCPFDEILGTRAMLFRYEEGFMSRRIIVREDTR